MFHNMRNLHDDRKHWIETYEKLFPDRGVTQYKRVWASLPPMEMRLSKWQWYAWSIFGNFVNWVIYMIIEYFMVVQSANGDLQHFVLNLIAAEFGTKSCRSPFADCIIKGRHGPSFKLPTTALEGALDEMALRFKWKNKEKDIRIKRENEEKNLRSNDKNEEIDLHFEEMSKMISDLQGKKR